jgi:hypothetical protein
MAYDSCYRPRGRVVGSAFNAQGGRPALIACSVFTAFMLEGVVHSIGSALSSTWDDRAKPFPKKHNRIRALMQLDNSSTDYQQIRNVIDRAFEFRHHFADPKILQ